MDPEALVTMNCVQKILPEDAAEGKQNMGYLRTMLTQQIEENLPDDKVALAKELTNSVLEVLEKTVDSGKTDGAGSLSVGAEGASLVLGMHVAGGEKLNGVVKRLVEMLEKEKPEAAKWIKLDAEEHAGVKFHRFSLPLSELRGPKKDELAQMRKVFGPSIDVVLGVSDQALYLGAGRDALAALKTAIDKSKESGGKLVAPAEISFSAKAVLRLVAMVAPKKDAQTAEKILKQLEGTKDKVHILAKSIPNGMEMQFELQEGVLKAIGQLAREAEGRPVGGPVKIMKRDRIKVPATQPADEDSDSDEKQ
jgi:hypothetical protein